MIKQCQNCGKYTEVKEYTWTFKKQNETSTGVIDCCESCKTSMEFEGYKMFEEGKVE